MIQKINKKYFWDGTENISTDFIIRRMLEYATFDDLIKIPLADIRNYLIIIDINKLRCDEKRKKFINLFQSYMIKSKNWEEAISYYINDFFQKEKIENDNN